jgi:methylmalonyl-CoA/ethylmalonyl-CoA epimerase
VKRLKGVVIRVRDLEATAARYQRILGVEPWPIPPEAFSAPGEVAGVRFDLGGTFLQLVAGVGEASALAKVTAKRGEGLSQLSFWVDDVDAEMAVMEAEGVEFTGPPRDQPLGRVVFAHPRSLNGVMWELEEHPDVDR